MAYPINAPAETQRANFPATKEEFSKLKAALITLFLDANKYVHETEKFIHNASLESQEEDTKSAQHAYFAANLRKKINQQLQTISLVKGTVLSEDFERWEKIFEKSYQEMGEGPFVLELIESMLTDNLEPTKQKNDFTMCKLIVNTIVKLSLLSFTLFKHYFEEYRYQANNFEGSNKDFFTSNALKIVAEGSFPEEIKKDLSDFFKDMHGAPYGNYFSIILNGPMLIGDVYVDDREQLSESISIIKSLALLTYSWEKNINKQDLGIFLEPACDTDFAKDVKTLKEYFISQMKKEGKLEDSFRFTIVSSDNSNQLKIHPEEYNKAHSLLKKELECLRYLLIEREKERLAIQDPCKNSTVKEILADLELLADQHFDSTDEDSDYNFSIPLVSFIASKGNMNTILYSTYTDSRHLLNLFYLDEIKTNQLNFNADTKVYKGMSCRSNEWQKLNLLDSDNLFKELTKYSTLMDTLTKKMNEMLVKSECM